MAKRSREIKTVEVSENKIVELSLDYSEGGTNFLAGGTIRRGLYLTATPYTVNGEYKSCILGKGIKSLILEMGRFSKKKLDECVVTAQMENELIEHLTADGSNWDI